MCLSAVFIASFASIHSAKAADKVQNMVYDVYAGGFRVVQADVSIDYSKKDRYYISMEAGTFGFLGRLAPWKGQYDTKGWIIGNDLRPEQHESTATWKEEVETHTYNYARNGAFKSYVVKEHDKPVETRKVDAEITKDTTDLLSATLKVMEHVAAGNKCEGSSEIFDGKRRFKQVFADQGEEDLKASRYNIYGGKARECTVEVIPTGGKWRDKPRGWMSIQEQGRERGMMPTLWMAQVSEGMPAVPVKIRVKTAYGTMFMHLAEYSKGEKLLVAEKRKD